MKLTRAVLAALLALSVGAPAAAPASAEPVNAATTASDFWFICC